MDPVIEVLTEARHRGFLGPGPVEAHIEHAHQVLPALPAAGVAIDLGSGGGVPGLPLAAGRPDLHWVLIDASERRTDWLREAIIALGLTASVRCERAETTGRGDLRGTATVVLARSFGRPAVTAECAAPLLRVGGTLWVASPPGTEDRWPPAGVALLGLAVGPRLPSWDGLLQEAACPDRYPRRVGVPAKRPLF